MLITIQDNAIYIFSFFVDSGVSGFCGTNHCLQAGDVGNKILGLIVALLRLNKAFINFEAEII